MTKKLAIPFVSAILLLSGCLSNESFALAESGNPAPSRSPQQEELMGPDKNLNRVRDDVDMYIDQNFPVEKESKAARQLARAIQHAILVEKSDQNQVFEISNEISKAVNCIFNTFTGDSTVSPSAVVEQLRDKTTNTKIRLKAYLEFSDSMAGTVTTSPSGNTCPP